MLYRNKNTGVIVDIQSEAGGIWEPVEEQAPVIVEPEKPAETRKAPEKKTTKKKTR